MPSMSLSPVVLPLRQVAYSLRVCTTKRAPQFNAATAVCRTIGAGQRKAGPSANQMERPRLILD